MGIGRLPNEAPEYAKLRDELLEAEIALRDQVERYLYETLGLGPRNEHVPVDLEVDGPELAACGDIGDRLTASAPRHERADGVSRLRSDVPLRPCIKLMARRSQRVGQEDLCFEPGRAHQRVETADRLRQHARDGSGTGFRLDGILHHGDFEFGGRPKCHAISPRAPQAGPPDAR